MKRSQKSPLDLLVLIFLKIQYLIGVVQTMSLTMWNVSIPCSDDTCTSLENVIFWLVFDQLCHAHLSSSDQVMSVVNSATWYSWSNTNQKRTFSKVHVSSEQGIETFLSQMHGLQNCNNKFWIFYDLINDVYGSIYHIQFYLVFSTRKDFASTT